MGIHFSHTHGSFRSHFCAASERTNEFVNNEKEDASLSSSNLSCHLLPVRETLPQWAQVLFKCARSRELIPLSILKKGARPNEAIFHRTLMQANLLKPKDRLITAGDPTFYFHHRLRIRLRSQPFNRFTASEPVEKTYHGNWIPRSSWMWQQ